MKIRFHPQLQEDIENILALLFHARPGWDELFSDEYDSIVDFVADNPMLYQRATETLPEQIRRAPFHRFSYILIYRVGLEFVDVLSLHHTSEVPRHWNARVSELE